MSWEATKLPHQKSTRKYHNFIPENRGQEAGMGLRMKQEEVCSFGGRIEISEGKKEGQKDDCARYGTIVAGTKFRREFVEG